MLEAAVDSVPQESVDERRWLVLLIVEIGDWVLREAGDRNLNDVARNLDYLVAFNRGKRISGGLGAVWTRDQQYTGAREVLDLRPERLVFYNVMTTEPVATARDAKALAATKQKISEIADQIRAGEFSAKPSFSCGYCDFKPLCPAHEQLISIQPAATLAVKN